MGSERLSEKIMGPRDEKELIKKIAEHEVYSTAYKIKLAAIVGKKAAQVAGKGALMAGKGILAATSLSAKGIHKVYKAARAKGEANRKDWD